MNEADKKEEGEDETAPLVRYTPAAKSPPPTIIKEMEEMFLRLGFNQIVDMKLVDDQRIDFPQTLASLSDEEIAAICNVIQESGMLVMWKMPDRGNEISVLAARYLKLVAFMFKTLEHCSKAYEIKHVKSISVLQYHYQCKLK